MLRICGCGVLLFALAAGVTAARNDDEVVGKVKTVDAKAKSFVMALADNTERTFSVNKETKFTGPRGSTREEGLKDPCMGGGYEIHVLPAADAKVAKEVKLAAWKEPPAKKKKGW